MLGAILALGFALAWMGLRRLLNRRLLVGGSNLIVGLLLVSISIAVAGIIANFYTYLQLTAEQMVGTVDFQKYADQEYIAKLTRSDGDIKRYSVFGDECQLDARILKWKGGGSLLGFETLYNLKDLAVVTAKSHRLNLPVAAFIRWPNRLVWTFGGLSIDLTTGCPGLMPFMATQFMSLCRIKPVIG